MTTNFLELTEVLHNSLVEANVNDKQFNIIWSAINDVHSKLRITSVGNPLNVFLVGDNVLFGHKKAKVIWTSVRYVDIQLIDGTMYQGIPTSVIKHYKNI